MDLALKTAENAGKAGEVPIGCVIVRDYKVIATRPTALDRPRSDRHARSGDPAGRRGHRYRAAQRMRPLCDAEPCTMCAGAISLARLRRLYFGAGDPRAARWNPACGSLRSRPVTMCRRSIRRSASARRQPCCGIFQGAAVKNASNALAVASGFSSVRSARNRWACPRHRSPSFSSCRAASPRRRRSRHRPKAPAREP